MRLSSPGNTKTIKRLQGDSQEYLPWMSQGIHINDLLRIQFYVSVNINIKVFRHGSFTELRYTFFTYRRAEFALFTVALVAGMIARMRRIISTFGNQLFHSVKGHPAKHICHLVWF